MCIVLNVPRSTYYAMKRDPKPMIEDPLAKAVKQVFEENREVYGARKIKAALARKGVVASRQRIRRLMKEQGLISRYTIKSYKVHRTISNEAKTQNVVNREFDGRKPLEVIVSDLTYVRVKNRWCYVCLILDLHSRKIIGYASGKQKTSDLVLKAFSSIDVPLHRIRYFHTDRGKEFVNTALERLLSTFGIQRSLSRKANPYDNAVAEATYKSFKTEFVDKRIFKNLELLQLELSDYVNWYNNCRLHQSLGYLTPNEVVHNTHNLFV
jgi:putative transposase